MIRKTLLGLSCLAVDLLHADGFLSWHCQIDTVPAYYDAHHRKLGTNSRAPVAKSSLRAKISSSCPFAKAFPRYKINLSKVPSKEKKRRFHLPFVSDFQTSLSKSNLEQKFRGAKVSWLNDDGDLEPTQLYASLWRLAADLGESSDCERTILALPSPSHYSSHRQLLQYWIDIFNWMQTQDEILKYGGENSCKIESIIYEDGDLLAVELKKVGNIQVPYTQQQTAMMGYDPSVLNKRTQSWVKRILVDQGICPFTKSVKVSGQGLGDLGIPVARIHYCSSNAGLDQICKLMADTWHEINYMLKSGPSGKEGISSILLAAPEFDVDFDLWSGPIFAMLEVSVVACRLEKQVGVVCFHPYYATPDGSSFPGFGHMHSVPRLQKWLKEQDPTLQEQLSLDEVAAGGAWQRRTPHATINVLRADQLEAAEGKRVTGELYTENIRKLVGKPEGIGSDKLRKDLEQERSLR